MKSELDPWIVYRLIWLDCWCHALQAQIEYILLHLENPAAEKVAERVTELTRALVQQKLENIESKNPKLAADIARYQKESDLPDEYL